MPHAETARKTAKALSWVYGGYIIEKLATLGSTLVLARLIAPHDFGIIATATLLIGFLTIVRDLGFTDALIYLDDDNNEAADACFWVNTALGTLLMIALVLLAPLLTRYTAAAPHLTQVLQLMALALPFSSMSVTHAALLQKQLKFGPRSIVDAATAVAKMATAIGLAAIGWGVWSIVAAFVLSAVFRCIGLYIALPWRPRLKFSSRHALDLFRFGKHLVLNGLVGEIQGRLDQLVLLNFFGSLVLGYYFIAAKLPELMFHHFGLVITRVLYPVFARLGGNRESVAAYTLQSTRYLAYILFPLAIGLVSVAEPAVLVMFGYQWLPSVPFLITASLCSLAAMAMWTVGDGVKAIGRPDLLLGLTVLDTITVGVSTIAAAKIYGTPIAACWGMFGALVVTSHFRAILAKFYLGIPLLSMLAAIARPLLGSLIMAGVLHEFKTHLGDVHPAIELGLGVALGAVVYLSFIALTDGRRLWSDLKLIVATRSPTTVLDASAP